MVEREVKALQSHIMRGCLSGIPPQTGTNRNENLHCYVNPYFSRYRLGIPLALAILTRLLHRHNQNYSNVAYVFSARASYGKDFSPSYSLVSHFGIIR